VTAVVVLGAGEIGGAVTQAIAASGVVRRVTLVDEAGDVARGKALDLAQSAPIDGIDTQIAGAADLAVVVGAAAIVVADRHGSSGEWRGEEALQLLARVRGLAPQALVVCGGCHQLDLVERAVLEQHADRRRLVGAAPEALRSAVAALAALEAGAHPAEVSLAVLGRPPGDAFVPWDDAAIAGRRATAVLAAPVLARLDARVGRLWPLGPLALAAAAARVVRLALGGGPGSACVFGVPDRSADVPTRGAALPARFSSAGAALDVPQLSTRDRVRLDGVLGR
jgi:hypothetical protein